MNETKMKKDIWQGFRRQAVCTNLRLPRPLTPCVADGASETGGSVQICLPRM